MRGDVPGAASAASLDLAVQLGLRVDDERGVHHGLRGATQIPGLSVAGDTSCDNSLVIVAAAEGAVAARAIHEGLWRQDCGG